MTGACSVSACVCRSRQPTESRTGEAQGSRGWGWGTPGVMVAGYGFGSTRVASGSASVSSRDAPSEALDAPSRFQGCRLPAAVSLSLPCHTGRQACLRAGWRCDHFTAAEVVDGRGAPARGGNRPALDTRLLGARPKRTPVALPADVK